MSVGEVLQIVLSGLTLFTVILMFFQFRYQKKDYKNKYILETRINAIKRAEWFSSKIDVLSFFITVNDMKVDSLLLEAGISNKVIKNVNFDVKELNQLVEQSKYKTMDKFYNEYKQRLFSDPLDMLNALTSYKLIDSDDNKILMNIFSEVENGELNENDRKKITLFVIDKYNELLNSTLNQLESFSMYFTSGVADDKVVFDSLHQIFIRFIRSQYVKIAKNNVNNTDKYYTHCISLYNEWSCKREQDSEEEMEFDRCKNKKHKMNFK